MGKGFLSVEVSERLVKVCVCSGTLKKRRLKESFVFEVSEDVVCDGQILNARVFSDVLTRELEKRNCAIRDVVFVVGSKNVITREVLMPLLSESRVAAVVEVNKESYFPMDLSGYVVRHRVMSRSKEGKEIHVLVMAMPEKLVAMCHSVEGFRVLGVDSVSFSLMGGLSVLDVKETTCFVHVDEGYTIVYVMKGKKVLYQRWFTFGGDHYIQECLSHSDSSVSYLQAVEKLCGSEAEQYVTDLFSEDEVEEFILPIVGSITRALDGFCTSSEEVVSKIVLTGSCGALFGVVDWVEGATKLYTYLLHEIPEVVKVQGLSGNYKKVASYVSGLYGCDSGIDFSEKKKEKKDRKWSYTKFGSGIDFRPVLLVGMLMAMYAVYCGYTYEDGEWKK